MCNSTHIFPNIIPIYHSTIHLYTSTFLLLNKQTKRWKLDYARYFSDASRMHFCVTMVFFYNDHHIAIIPSPLLYYTVASAISPVKFVVYRLIAFIVVGPFRKLECCRFPRKNEDLLRMVFRYINFWTGSMLCMGWLKTLRFYFCFVFFFTRNL